MRTIWKLKKWYMNIRVIYMEAKMIKFNVYWVSVYFVEGLGMSFSIGSTCPRASQTCCDSYTYALLILFAKFATFSRFKLLQDFFQSSFSNRQKSKEKFLRNPAIYTKFSVVFRFRLTGFIRSNTIFLTEKLFCRTALKTLLLSITWSLKNQI